ncbi:hypothetical protein U1Q18_005633, partial [Sarracenia purpurea var. burkii]
KGIRAVEESIHYHEDPSPRGSDWSDGEANTRQYTKRRKNKAVKGFGKGLFLEGRRRKL